VTTFASMEDLVARATGGPPCPSQRRVADAYVHGAQFPAGECRNAHEATVAPQESPTRFDVVVLRAAGLDRGRNS